MLHIIRLWLLRKSYPLRVVHVCHWLSTGLFRDQSYMLKEESMFISGSDTVKKSIDSRVWNDAGVENITMHWDGLSIPSSDAF